MTGDAFEAEDFDPRGWGPFASLDGAIAAVLASTDRELGVDEDAAEQLRERIADSGRTDSAALQAYDLLHQRATFGRAF